MVYMIPAMLVEDRLVSKLFVTATFLSGLAITFYIVINDTRSALEVWARGSLVWAVEWILATIVPIYVSRIALRESAAYTSGNSRAQEIAEVEAWRAAGIGIGFCCFMAIVSYTLHLVASRSQKQ